MTYMEFNNQLMSLNNQLRGFALTLTSNAQDAEDLMQDTYLKALKNRDKYRDYSNFKAWIFTITKNTYINLYRKKKRQGQRYDELVKANDTLFSVKMDTESWMSIKEIDGLVNDLEYKFRYPLQLYISGYKYEEIADIMHLKLGTVKSRIFMARKKLKDFRQSY